jgi:hypothetical protein
MDRKVHTQKNRQGCVEITALDVLDGYYYK